MPIKGCVISKHIVLEQGNGVRIAQKGKLRPGDENSISSYRKEVIITRSAILTRVASYFHGVLALVIRDASDKRKRNNIYRRSLSHNNFPFM